MDALFEKVREEATRGAWSAGVELARAGAVQGEREAEDEVVLRVQPRSGVVSPSVVLLLEDLAWECDCRDDDDPCAHVAAAVIALRRARREGRSLPAAAAVASGRVVYGFRTTPTGLALERRVRYPGGEEPLTGTLTALA
ncbi:MAG: SWIM zinc finger family protein, partial [Myxococcota bacterium]